MGTETFMADNFKITLVYDSSSFARHCGKGANIRECQGAQRGTERPGGVDQLPVRWGHGRGRSGPATCGLMSVRKFPARDGARAGRCMTRKNNGRQVRAGDRAASRQGPSTLRESRFFALALRPFPLPFARPSVLCPSSISRRLISPRWDSR